MGKNILKINRKTPPLMEEKIKTKNFS